MVKILDINVTFLKRAATHAFSDNLSQEIEERLARLHNMEGLPYRKTDIVQLISSIETNKFRFILGEISAKRLYFDVDYDLNLFTLKHPGFDYMKDPALNAYFS